jgi:hypothetical protein
MAPTSMYSDTFAIKTPDAVYTNELYTADSASQIVE